MKKIPITDLYVKCSYPMKPRTLAASDMCQKPASTGVTDKDGNIWYRCPKHLGQLGPGVAGKVVYATPGRPPRSHWSSPW